ncbi:MAG: hypothetical protein RR645_00565 [Clostridium sp.]
MMFFKQILIIFITAVVALIIYIMVKPFIFNKLKPNKWVVIILLAITFFVPISLPQIYSNFITSTIFFILITILALTFVDLIKLGKIDKSKPIVGKPKPKPNRSNIHTK